MNISVIIRTQQRELKALIHTPYPTTPSVVEPNKGNWKNSYSSLSPILSIAWTQQRELKAWKWSLAHLRIHLEPNKGNWKRSKSWRHSGWRIKNPTKGIERQPWRLRWQSYQHSSRTQQRELKVQKFKVNTILNNDWTQQRELKGFSFWFS